MKIQPIVEGEGEEAAFPVLLRRLRNESGAFDIVIQRPFRRRRSELVQEASLRRIVRSALLLGWSFRRLVNAFGIVASQAGATLQEWPPPSWLAGP